MASKPISVAVTVMDRLRSPGGCPWDAEQDHDSLRRYLVEETYELLDAIEQRDRASLREELGDVLLQVLFHARVAAEDGTDPFDVDEVAAGLVSKLVSRHPNVFADDGAVLDAEPQHARWEELKQREKQRESVVDGVATGQPAAALAAKLVQRADRGGLPQDLLPAGESVGERLFALVAQARLGGADPEDDLRGTALAFAERVAAFGVTVHAVAKPDRDRETLDRAEAIGVRFVDDLTALARTCDVLSFHVPATADTRHLVDRGLLSHVQPGTIILNTSRSDVVDEAALLEAMDAKGVRAGLDVFADEPGGGTGEIDSKLARHPNVYGTHHIGASTEQAQLAVADEVVRMVDAFARGEVLHQVNTP